MPTQGEILGLIKKTETYLTQSLLPFWSERCADRECGGALTYFDRHGRPTGETVKPFLMQARILYTLSSAHRAGYGDGHCAELAEAVARFILDHYWREPELRMLSRAQSDLDLPYAQPHHPFRS